MRLPRTLLVFLAVSWAFVVLYPDPSALVRSVQNLAHPRIDPAAVTDIAARLPDDPRLIEAYVLDQQVPYAYDWQTAGVPWSFPTTRDALKAGAGDCESRAVVLASILAAKGIPHSLRVSFDHIWVDYPGKAPNALENAGVEVAGVKDGRFFIHWPQDFHLGQEIQDQLTIYWTPAPLYRVLLLFGGLLLIVLWNTSVSRFAGERGGRSPSPRMLRSTTPADWRFAARSHRV